MLSTSLLAGVAGPDLWAAGAENGIPYRRLGRAGERVSLVGLGGWHLGIQPELAKQPPAANPEQQFLLEA